MLFEELNFPNQK